MSKEFNIGDMIFFIGKGSDFSKTIQHGVVSQKDYTSVSRDEMLSLSCYHVIVINDMGVLEDLQLFPECAFGSIDELLSNLKESYDPMFYLESFSEEMGKYHRGGRLDVYFNIGIKEALREGYESAVLDSKVKV